MKFCQSNNVNFFTSFGKDILESSHIQQGPIQPQADFVELNVYDRLNKVRATTKRSVIKKVIETHSKPLNNIKSFSFHDDRFRRDYDKITNAIELNSLDKGVAFNTLKIEFEEKLTVNHFLNFSQDSIERNHAYGIWSEDSGIIGLSPELLLSKIDEKYIIDALAGTSDKESGLDSPKLVNEHQTVVDSITEKLDQQNIRYEVGEKFKIKFRHYYHWYQQIIISAQNDAVNIIDSIAPTAAISGYPSNEFKKLRSSLEFESNNRFLDYAGCFHFKHHYFEKIIIGIRNIQWEGSTAYIHAGCGINRDSLFREELAESHMKMKTTLRYFGYEIS